MPKQLNVNLAFTADTREAKAQLASLQQDLNKLTQSVGSKSPLGITKDINSAIGEVNKLQAALTKATTSSGSLDLGQFRKELNSANLDAQKIAQSLSSLGPEGQAAFAKLAQSVTLAEVPIKKVNNTLTQFATTLANTARWQISSSVLHGFMGALQGAYRYAQDLNKSLNSIRIVTGQSSDQMAEFAKHANESAKALSATTTAYTDASLIFFQQGLTGDAVTERTDAVIKMSNVTGDSVEDVASYMTAIWNNFDDGSQSLEYFADVITALGAATASSSAEISAGLEKFASIAETVGLSYDYATSALATVVATTRQSADTVGTAFKTLFARIQGLKLGETLEDGVDLNKYSQALNAVGVQVLDVSGNMRNLDDILDDLAVRWKMLSSAQQTALAQTVAGTRQYNQLVALMSNWDFMEENLEVARNAEGSLQEQADIYAESWEAAQKRVKAAWQEIYNQLLDDKFFIGLTNGFGKVLNEVSNVIDAFGGLKGVIPLLSTALLSLFGDKLANSINNATFNIELFSKKGQESLEKLRDSFNQQNLNNVGDKSITSIATTDAYMNQAEAQNALLLKTRELAASNKEISEFEQIQAEQLLDQLKTYNEIYLKNAQILEQEQAKSNTAYENATLAAENFQGQYKENYGEAFESEGIKDDFTVQINNIHELQAQYTALIQIFDEFREKSIVTSDDVAQSGLGPIIEKFKELNTEGDTRLNSLIEKLEQLKNASSENIDQTFNELVEDIESLGEISYWSYDKLKQFISILRSIKGENAIPKDAIDNLNNSIENLFQTTSKTGEALNAYTKAGANAKNATKATLETFSQFSGNAMSLGDQILEGTKALSTFGMALSSITGLIDTLNNPDTSGIDKFISTLTTLGIAIPMVNSAIKSLNTTFGINVLAVKENAAAVAGLVGVLTGKTTVLYSNIVAEKLNTLAEKEETAELAKRLFGEEALISAEKQGITIESIKTALEEKGIKLSALRLGALVKRILGEEALNEELKKQIVLETLLKGLAGFAVVGIMAVVAVVKLYQQHLENVAKRSQEVADSHKKLTDTVAEETKTVNELTDKYNDLRQQEKEGLITQAELTSQAAKLANEYDNQKDIVLSLAGAYGDLDNAIKNMQDDANQKLFESSSVDVKNYATSLKDGLVSAAGGRSDNYGDTIDLKEMVDRNENEERFAEALESLNINFKNSDHIYTEDLVNAIINHKDELDKILATYSDTEAAHQILGYMQELDSLINNASESLERYQESALSLAFNQNFDENDFNLISFMKKMREDDRVQAANLTDEEVRDWVIKQIAGIKEVSNYAQSYQVALALYDEDLTEKELTRLANQIEQFSNSDKALIMLYPTIAGDFVDKNGNLDLEGLKENFQNQLNYSENKGNANTAMSFMSEYNENGSFSDINSVAELLGIDVNSFTDEEIYNKLDEFYQTSLDSANQYYEEAIREASDFADQMSQEITNAAPSQEDIDAYYEEVYNQLRYGKVWENATAEQADDNAHRWYEEFQNFIDEYEEATRNGEELSEDVVNTLTSLRNVYGNEIIDDLIKGYEELNPDVSEFEEKLSEANEMLENTTELTVDWAGKAQGLQTRIKGINKAIDDLQAAYKEFAAAEKEFNEKGYYSVDTIQSLLNLSPEYLQYITIEDGQIRTLSGDIADQQNAYYDLLEAKYADYYLTQARILTQENENKELYEQTLRTWQLNFAQASANDTMSSAIGIVQDLASAYAEGTEQAEAFANILETMAKVDELISTGRKSVDKNPEGAMGATPKGGSKDRKETKEYLKEFDRLYPIKKAIEDLADAISDLDKKKSHLMGQSLVEALSQENEMLAQQRDLYEELLNQQSDYRNELAGALQQFGATFDSNTGNLTNYLEITQAALDKYNAAVDAYNSSHDKGAFSIADEEYKYFKEVLSAYQTILTDMTDTQNKLDDNFLQQIENNLKSFEAEIKVDLDFDEAQRKVNNFFKDINANFKKMYKSTKEWADLFTTATKNVDTYTKGAGSTIETDLRALQEVADFIDSKGYDSDDPNRLFLSRDDAINKYKELSDQLMEDAQDLYDLYEDTWDNYLNAIDEVKDQWNDILKGFDRVNNTLKHYEQIAELLYGGDKYATGREYLDQIYSTSSKNSIAKQNTLKQEIEALRKEYEEIRAMGVEENDQDLVKIKEAIQEAESSLEDEIENYLDIIQSQLVNSIKNIMDTANRNMTKGYGVDLVIERWNDAKDAAEGYYDEVERVYEIEKLESEWENVINSTTSTKNQQYLTSLMNEQLKNLKEKTKLSEYDIGLAEKELAIYQAQMALEDARNNKNAMKVVRNEQGDWAYQYVADEDEVASKEEDLMNKTYEKYEYVKNESNEATEALIQLYQTAQERLSELLEEYKYADDARRQEIAEQYEYLYNYYYGPDGVIIQKAAETHAMEDDLNIAGMELLWELYEKDIENYNRMIDSEKGLIDELREHNINSFSELITGVATGDDSLYNQLFDKVSQVTADSRTQWEELAHSIIEEWATNPDSVRAAVTFAYDSIMGKVGEYDQAILLSEEISGLAWSDITGMVNLAEVAVGQVEEAVWRVIEQTGSLSNFRQVVEEMGNAWLEVRGKILSAVNMLQTYLSLLGVAANAKLPEYETPLIPTPSNKIFSGDGDNGSGGGGSKRRSQDDEDPQQISRPTFNLGHTVDTIAQTLSTGNTLTTLASLPATLPLAFGRGSATLLSDFVKYGNDLQEYNVVTSGSRLLTDENGNSRVGFNFSDLAFDSAAVNTMIQNGISTQTLKSLHGLDTTRDQYNTYYTTDENGRHSTIFNFEHLELPNVDNYEQFIMELEKAADIYASQTK